MLSLILIGSLPVVAAAVAFVCMDRPWWEGGLVLGLLIAVLYAVPVGPGRDWLIWAFLAALVGVVGWIAAVIGTRMLADESYVAGMVYLGVSSVLILLWILLPEGTF